ncbi:MAG TPA: hypothetical protein PKA10_02140 [Selenomonadales bacterium]|nr:hypothetical protein [Selenomonadales bacterium]
MFKWRELFSAPPSVLTVVGMAKNAGKTVAMNYIQAMLRADGHTIGLTSVGRDGEQFDALTLLAKPAVGVEPGTLVATAEATVVARECWDCLERIPIRTPLGAVGILRARDKTQVVLAGPSKNSEVQAVVKKLAGHGADCVIIDGAFDRQSSADPTVSEQVVLATGATLSRNMAELIDFTRTRIEQLALPPAGEHLAAAAGAEARIVALAAGERREIPAPTTLLGEEDWRRIIGAGADTLMLRGAVGDGLAAALLREPAPPAIIVVDGSKIFIRPELWRRLMAKNVRIFAARPINLLGVTVNPSFPGGEGLDPDELLAAMGRTLYPVPVIDIVREKRYRP